MAKKVLLDADVKLGERILGSLDGAKFPISVAVWTLTEEQGWQLVIGTPLYEKGGPLEAYGKLITALRKTDPESRDFDDVRLISNRDPFIRDLRRTFEHLEFRKGARTSGMIGNRYVEDAVVYRIK